MSCFWPVNEPRIHAQIVSISAPFDCGQKVELLLEINHRREIHGQIRLQIPVEDANNYRIGDVYAAHFKLVSEMRPR